mmetsp:Transcript_146694/g.365800  ORF Transcript_146694/g.365800 Transcript_146694/m.365800 type:complete len:204 (-) Transcript_146694:1043-1654(-)
MQYAVLLVQLGRGPVQLRRCHFQAMHDIPHDLLLGLGANAMCQDLGQALHAQSRCCWRVHPLPCVLQVRFDHLRVVDFAHANPFISQSHRVSHLVPGIGANILLPLLEKALWELLFSDVRIFLLHLPRHHVHEPICWILVGRHYEAEALEVRLGLLCGTEESSPAAFPKQKNVVNEREEAISGLVDDHDDGHAQLGHLLQRPD